LITNRDLRSQGHRLLDAFEFAPRHLIFGSEDNGGARGLGDWIVSHLQCLALIKRLNLGLRFAPAQAITSRAYSPKTWPVTALHTGGTLRWALVAPHDLCDSLLA
jgi:hypothetical protein